MKAIIIVSLIIAICFAWWFVGGIHLEYLQQNAQNKLGQYSFKNCVYDGYKRTLFDTFGGQVYYTCYNDGIYYTVYFGRRINNKEIQMYGPKQMTTFPNKFEVTN